MNAPEASAGRNERLLFGLPLLGVYAMVVVAFIATVQGSPLRQQISGATLLIVAALAGIASLYRWRSERRRHNHWLLFGIAGLAAATSHVARSIGLHADVGSWLLLVSYVAFTVGTALAVYNHDRGGAFEVSLDTALVLGAASVVVFRWSPAAAEVLFPPAEVPILIRASVVVSAIAAIASLFFALILLTESASASSVGVAGAAISFAIATIPLALSGVNCCVNGNPLTLAAVSGWIFLTYGALRRDSAKRRTSWPASWRLRYVIAPGVAVLMAVVLVDTAINPPMRQPTAIALGSVGLLLSLRLTDLLQMSSRRTREQKELAQTRALIEVTNALASETDLNATLGEVAVVSRKLLDARATSLELLTDDGQTLEIKASTGLPSEVIGMKFPVNNSFTGWVVKNNLPRTTPDPAADPLVAESSKQLLGHSPTAAVPLRHRGHPIGTLSCIGERPFDEEDLELLSALANQASIAIENARLFQQVHSLSMTDPLTGLANRRQLERDINREFAAARRGRKLIAVMFDLNGFKKYNDKYGHLAGDAALRAFGAALANETRAMNLAVRYGGDEFLVLLADSDVYGAEIFVQRVKSGFREELASANAASLTAEAGLAAYTKEMKSPDDLIAAADEALYRSKAARSST